MKLENIDDKNTAAKLNEIKREMLAICTLTNKVRNLENKLMKEEELKLLKSSMKFTLIKELQIEAQTYFNEARRLKNIIDNELINNEKDNEIELAEEELGVTKLQSQLQSSQQQVIEEEEVEEEE